MTHRRRAVPDDRPVALTVAGSDSGGGAGIQADCKTMAALGVVPTSAVTSVTAQHTRGVESTHVLPTDEVEAQIDAVCSDFEVRAAKTGMLATESIVRTVTERLRAAGLPLVVDPVMVAASGDPLLEPDPEQAYEALLAEATIATPNADEAAVLTGVDVEDPESARAAGDTIREFGADAALVKGGHVPGDAVVDVLVTADGDHRFESPRVETDATHGSGCTLSSAITAAFATAGDRNPAPDRIVEAVETGIEHARRAIRYPLDVGEGPGAVNHLVPLRDRAARTPTSEAVADLVATFERVDVSPLAPEVGITVAAATPYAERPEEVAAVEGRITPTLSGARAPGGVRMGASSHVARFLLAGREFDPDLRYACNVRFDDRVAVALSDLDWTVAEFDRRAQPDDVQVAEGSTMTWGARQAFEAVDRTPDAVVDEGAVGKEPMTRVLATDRDGLSRKVRALLDGIYELGSE